MPRHQRPAPYHWTIPRTPYHGRARTRRMAMAALAAALDMAAAEGITRAGRLYTTAPDEPTRTERMI